MRGLLWAMLLVPVVALAEELPDSLGPFVLEMERSDPAVPDECRQMDDPRYCHHTVGGIVYSAFFKNDRIASINATFDGEHGRSTLEALTKRFGGHESWSYKRHSGVYNYRWYERKTKPHRLLSLSWPEGLNYRGIPHPTRSTIVVMVLD